MTDLSNKYRPKNLQQFIGQSHIISTDKPLYKLIKKKEIPHLFFYGKPGTGKTTLAKIIAKEINSDYYYFNATSIKVEDLRKVFDKYKGALIKPIIFIDEVHRLSKNQQEVLLPVMENYDAIIIGASTENPFFTLTNAIRSRSFLFKFEAFTNNDLEKILDVVLKDEDVNIDKDAKEYLINTSAGDARAMLTLLNFSIKIDKKVKLDLLKELRSESLVDGVSSNDTHYDIASAMIKSIRGSDVNAALYYLARLIVGGENIDFITRRLVILASEDIGNANPNALSIAVNTMTACKTIGYPESRIILSQCVIYLASCPKSNSSYTAINKVINEIKNGNIMNIPSHIDSLHKGYLYPHDYNGYVKQDYLEKTINVYESNLIGFEKTLDEWIKKIKGEN